MSENKITNLADAIRQKMEESKNKDIPKKVSEKNKQPVLKPSPQPYAEHDTDLINKIKRTSVSDMECVRLTLRLPADIHLPLQFITDSELSLNKMAVYGLTKLLEEQEIQNKINEKLKRLIK